MRPSLASRPALPAVPPPGPPGLSVADSAALLPPPPHHLEALQLLRRAARALSGAQTRPQLLAMARHALAAVLRKVAPAEPRAPLSLDLRHGGHTRGRLEVPEAPPIPPTFASTVDTFCAHVAALLATLEALDTARLARSLADACLSTLEQADAGLLLLDGSGRILDGSPGAARLIGLPVEQLRGLPLARFYGPAEAAGGLPDSDLALAAREGRLELLRWMQRPDGRPLWLELVLNRHTSDELPGFVVACRSRRIGAPVLEGGLLATTLELDAALRQATRMAVPFLGDACVLEVAGTDERGRRAVAHVDPAREPALLGLGRSAHTPSALPSLLQEVQRLRRPLLIQPRTREELLLTPAEHLGVLRELGWSALLAVPLLARVGPLGVLCLGLTTDERRYRPDDVCAVEELAGRAALAIENAQLHENATFAIRARDEFLSIASHELKTPLTSLLLQLQGALRRLRRPGEDDRAELEQRLEAAERQTKRLGRLINDLLDVSRVSGGVLELQRESLDLNRLLHDVVSRFGEELALAGCSLTLRAPTSVVGEWDRLRIDQVISNLLSNAAKYGAGRPVELTLEADPVRALLRVRDHGPGLAPEDRARIFGLYERGRAVRTQPGLGLGLYIARQIVLAHGGEIAVESGPEPGACFVVSLPRARSRGVTLGD